MTDESEVPASDTMASSTSAEAVQQAAELHKAGKFVEAEALLYEALERDPGNSDLLNARGVVFSAMERHTDALWCYRDAIAHNPNSPGIWTNLGNTLTHFRQLKCAIECHKRAIAHSKPDALFFRNLGTSLAEAGRHSEAVIAFTRALEIEPDYHTARLGRAGSYLNLGDYRQGWADYEVRLVSGKIPHKKLTGQKWDGSRYDGKRLLLAVEQGFGDTIWAARYLPRVKALGGELYVECQRELIPLIERLGVVDRLIPHGEPLPTADFHGHLCSLPGVFTPELASNPATPYLPAPMDRVAKFRPAMEQAGERFRVGIVWSGSIIFGRNHERARSLTHFLRAFAMPGVQLYSLQKGPTEEELKGMPKGLPIVNLAPLIDDFADTAAAISQLDLVIMTDSAVAHLAGALGKPVWVLLGHVAYWLWMQDRTDTPWYSSMRLFRPRAENDWDYVFDTAAVKLMALIKS